MIGGELNGTISAVLLSRTGYMISGELNGTISAVLLRQTGYILAGELSGTISALLLRKTGYMINDEIIRQRVGVENRQVRKQLRRLWEAGEREVLNDKGEDY